MIRFTASGTYAVFARASPVAGARYRIPEAWLPRAGESDTVVWREVDVAVGSPLPSLPAQAAHVVMTGREDDSNDEENTYHSDEDVTAPPLEVLPVEATTRFIPAGFDLAAEGNVYYATSEMAAMADLGVGKAIVTSASVDLFCLAQYFPTEEAFDDQQEVDWMHRAGIPRLNLNKMMPGAASIDQLVPLPQDLVSDGLDSMGSSSSGIIADFDNAFRCGSPRLLGPAGGIYLDLARLAGSIAHRRAEADRNIGTPDEAQSSMNAAAGPVDDTVMNAVYQKRTEDAQTEFGTPDMAAYEIVDQSADEDAAGRLEGVERFLLRPGLWVLRLGTSDSSVFGRSTSTFSPKAIALLVYARLPPPVLAAAAPCATAWVRSAHPDVPGASRTIPNGGPLSRSEQGTGGDFGLVIGVDVPGFGPATVNYSQGENQGERTGPPEVFAPTARIGFTVPFAMEPSGFDLLQAFGTSDSEKGTTGVTYYCSLDGSVPQRPPRFTGRARSAQEARSGWYTTQILGAEDSSGEIPALLPSAHHVLWDADADMKLLWSGGMDISGTSLSNMPGDAGNDTNLEGWVTQGTNRQSMWEVPSAFYAELSRRG